MKTRLTKTQLAVLQAIRVQELESSAGWAAKYLVGGLTGPTLNVLRRMQLVDESSSVQDSDPNFQGTDLIRTTQAARDQLYVVSTRVAVEAGREEIGDAVRPRAAYVRCLVPSTIERVREVQERGVGAVDWRDWTFEDERRIEAAVYSLVEGEGGMRLEIELASAAGRPGTWDSVQIGRRFPCLAYVMTFGEQRCETLGEAEALARDDARAHVLRARATAALADALGPVEGLDISRTSASSDGIRITPECLARLLVRAARGDLPLQTAEAVSSVGGAENTPHIILMPGDTVLGAGATKAAAWADAKRELGAGKLDLATCRAQTCTARYALMVRRHGQPNTDRRDVDGRWLWTDEPIITALGPVALGAGRDPEAK